jgi:hypothetical protein
MSKEEWWGGCNWRLIIPIHNRFGGRGGVGVGRRKGGVGFSGVGIVRKASALVPYDIVTNTKSKSIKSSLVDYNGLHNYIRGYNGLYTYKGLQWYKGYWYVCLPAQ